MAYYRVYYSKASTPPVTGSLDVTADTSEAAEAHARYTVVDPERKFLGIAKYGDRRLQISQPQLVQAAELPAVTIDRTVPLQKIVNRFAEV